MAFWSGEKLLTVLDSLVTDFDKDRIDCASYRLRLGDEVYVSPAGEERDWSKRKKILLDRPGADFVIPPGQFAFLLTEEEVRVPRNAIAFISMRSKIKFRGLVNVSGFHVDPGYDGKLIFSVFNAGPLGIRLERGEEYFVIFYADLDRRSDQAKEPGSGYRTIGTDVVNAVVGDTLSLESLRVRMDDGDKRLSDRILAIERDHSVVKWATALVVTLTLGLAVKACLPDQPSTRQQPAQQSAAPK